MALFFSSSFAAVSCHVVQHITNPQKPSTYKDTFKFLPCTGNLLPQTWQYLSRLLESLSLLIRQITSVTLSDKQDFPTLPVLERHWVDRPYLLL